MHHADRDDDAIKSSHIIIDNDNIPKPIDFGICAYGNMTMFHFEDVLGTEPYIAVEYKRKKILITKANIFSYGVDLLEMISSREPNARVDMTITEWAARCRWIINMKQDTDMSGMFDPRLLDSIARDDRVRILSLLGACIQPDHSKRLKSGQLVSQLLAMSCLTQVASSSTR
ncbi:hypothetical protein L1887_35981 [Cichorium endivia]|nr:hypothetical protein L1887_35981 [Cichorium endivia]